MSKRRVLAISNDLDQLRRIVSTLERAEAEVDAVRSVETIAGELIPHRYVFFSATDGDVGALNVLVGHNYQPDVNYDYEPHLEYLASPYEGFRAYLSAMYQY